MLGAGIKSDDKAKMLSRAKLWLFNCEKLHVLFTRSSLCNEFWQLFSNCADSRAFRFFDRETFDLRESFFHRCRSRVWNRKAFMNLLFCCTNFFTRNILHFMFFFFVFFSHSPGKYSECAHQTFTFDGRCWNMCPERTFIVPEKISSGIASSKGLSLRKREVNNDEFDNLQDIIGRTESLVKNRAIMKGSSQKLCGSCHESCTRCNGPLDSDCVDCEPEYNQIIIGSSVSCRRKLANSTDTLLNSIKSELKSYSTLKITLISVLMVISLVITCISIYLLCRKYDSDNGLASDRDKNFLSKYSYGRINQETEEVLLTRLTKAPIEAFVDDSDDSEWDLLRTTKTFRLTRQ